MPALALTAPALAGDPSAITMPAPAMMPGMVTTLCMPALPAPPTVPTILAVPFLAAVSLAVMGALDVSPAVCVPGTAAWPALAVPASDWPWIPAIWAPVAEPPVAVPPSAGLTALTNSPLLTKPATP